MLRGLSFGTAGGVTQLLLYVSRDADAAAVEREARGWLRGRARAGDAADVPLPLLLLVVDGLPMGALVEAQIEAADPSAPPLAQLAWQEERAHGLDLSCAAVVGGLSRPAAGGAASALGMLQCAVGADAGCVTGAQLGAALRDALAAFRRRLADAGSAPSLGDACYVRCFHEVGLLADNDRAALRRALRTLGSPDDAAGCAVVDLPVRRVAAGHARARLAVQVCVAACAGRASEDNC